MKVLLLGAGGMLGRDLAAAAPSPVTVISLPRSALDITDFTAVSRVLEDLRPSIILNAAAYTAVDRAETEPDAAYRVNAEAVARLATNAVTLGARLVHFSTDYVFDGTSTLPYDEGAHRSPLNVYGASKAEGEDGVRAASSHHLIIRTQWLFGDVGECFPRRMHQRATRRQTTRVVADQVGRPTYAKDLAVATWQLVLSGHGGVVHVANEGQATWWDVAKEVFQSVGTLDLLSPCATEEFPTLARRPLSSVLSTSLSERLLGAPLRPWRDALAEFLETVVT
jgi:dTDP-4-dehydrorhamnose reductase